MVVAQLIEQSLPIPEIFRTLVYLLSTEEWKRQKNKEKAVGIGPFKKIIQHVQLVPLRFVTKFVSNARLLDHFGSELVYILPTTDRQKGAGLENFEKLFAALDKHMGKLQICSYGLSDTTLEEVNLPTHL